ncbi:MAG: hypothetical protein R3316_08315 [Rhodovibrionaceae bacterium]|nr:hypothetical protein [Rhodovibrionaceae bacterium]
MSEMAGVYAHDKDGREQLIHEYFGGDYGLEDIPEFLGIGALDDGGEVVRLHLSAQEIARLKLEMDASGFDYEPDFVQMCLDIHRFVTANTLDGVSLKATF